MQDTFLDNDTSILGIIARPLLACSLLHYLLPCEDIGGNGGVRTALLVTPCEDRHAYPG